MSNGNVSSTVLLTGHQKSSKTAICSSQFPSATRTEIEETIYEHEGKKDDSDIDN